MTEWILRCGEEGREVEYVGSWWGVFLPHITFNHHYHPFLSLPPSHPFLPQPIHFSFKHHFISSLLAPTSLPYPVPSSSLFPPHYPQPPTSSHPSHPQTPQHFKPFPSQSLSPTYLTNPFLPSLFPPPYPQPLTFPLLTHVTLIHHPISIPSLPIPLFPTYLTNPFLPPLFLPPYPQSRSDTTLFQSLPFPPHYP